MTTTVHDPFRGATVLSSEVTGHKWQPHPDPAVRAACDDTWRTQTYEFGNACPHGAWRTAAELIAAHNRTDA